MGFGLAGTHGIPAVQPLLAGCSAADAGLTPLTGAIDGTAHMQCDKYSSATTTAVRQVQQYDKYRANWLEGF